MFQRLTSAMPDLGGRVQRADVLLALALAVVSAVQVLWLLPIADRGIGLVYALGATLPVAWRRTRPVTAAIVGSAIWLIPTDGYIVVGYIAAFALYYSVGAYVADGRRVAVVTLLGLAIGIAATTINAQDIGEYLGSITAVVAPIAIGRFIRRERAQAQRLRDLTRHLEIERERSAHAAVAEERARIARELHDVVSHSISLIAIQSDAAEAALDRDSELARQPLVTIRGSARAALAEMRRLLGVLRDADEQPDIAPLPGLEQLPALVQRARSVGMAVEFEVSGTPRSAPASVDLSAYRIIQEALTNVRKHAGSAPTHVSVTWRQDSLSVEVRDHGPGPGAGEQLNGGHGLVGMGERVRLHGGELHVGAAPGGGFRVAAVLPLPREPA
jgi:signal transduction histidine kinase